MSIGLRVYRVTVHNLIDQQRVRLGTGVGELDLLGYFRNRIANGRPPVNEMSGRSLNFSPEHNAPAGSLHGLIQYGIFGYGAVIRDRATRNDLFQRNADHIEDIPLYYRLWVPSGESRGFAAFQSFQGRSCVDEARGFLISGFNDGNEVTRLVFGKLTPAEALDYGESPVARLRLSRPRGHSDAAQNIFGDNPDIDLELILRKRSRLGLGTLADIRRRLIGTRAEQGALIYEGMEFSNAIADVRVGNKYMPISVIGAGANTGVIDISDSVRLDAQGHPTFESIAHETADILAAYAMEH